MTTTEQYLKKSAEHKIRFIDPHALIQRDDPTTTSIRTVWLSGTASPLDQHALRTLAREIGAQLVDPPRRPERSASPRSDPRRRADTAQHFRCRIHEAKAPARRTVSDQQADTASSSLIIDGIPRPTLLPVLPVISCEKINQIATDGLTQANWPASWAEGSDHIWIETDGFGFDLSVHPVRYQGAWGVLLQAMSGDWEQTVSREVKVRQMLRDMCHVLGRFMSVDVFVTPTQGPM